MNKNLTSNGRKRFVFIVFLMLSLALTTRAFYLQVMTKDYLQEQGDQRYLRAVTVKANRGRIVDRRGEFLAVSTPVDSIWVQPIQYLSKSQDSTELLRLLDINEASFEEKLARYKDKQFLYLKRHLSPQKAQEILDLDIYGIYAQREYKRFYPGGTAAGHVVGFTNIDEKGQEGIELMFNDYLTGEDGKKYVLRDQKGNNIEHVKSIKDKLDGKDLQLSIDMRLQYITYQALSEAVKEHNAESASAVMVNPKTGEILALVNVPSFNPNNRDDFEPSSFRNRGVTDSYEPGSTIKPFTVAMGLENKIITPATLIDTNPGSITVGRKRIRDTRNYGVIDISKVVSKSSNVGVVKIAMQFEPEQVRSYFEKMGFGVETGVDIPGETRGNLRKRDKWYSIDHATLAYGYGFSNSILQMARAYSILASNGEKRPLSILKVDDEVAAEKVISDETIKQLVPMMKDVVTPEGTARRAELDEYTAAGKTATAAKLINGAYSKKQYVASFAGFAPASDPQLVLVVMVDNPKGELYYGGVVAAPVFKKVMNKSLPLMNVTPDKVDNLNIQKIKVNEIKVQVQNTDKDIAAEVEQ